MILIHKIKAHYYIYIVKRTSVFIAAFVSLFILSGCVSNVHSPYSSEQGNNNLEVLCPSEYFPEFIRLFSDSETLQRAFTTYPLKMQYLNISANPEPTPMMRTLTQKEIEFPVFPTQKKREEIPIEMKITQDANGMGHVNTFKPDSDAWSVSFFFKKKDGCWYLFKVEDWSL